MMYHIKHKNPQNKQLKLLFDRKAVTLHNEGGYDDERFIFGSGSVKCISFS